MDGDVGVVGAGCNGEGVPLPLRDGGDLEEEPLAGFVLEGGLVELNLDNVLDLLVAALGSEVGKGSKLTVGVADNARDLGLPALADLAIKTLNKVQPTSPELPPPAKVPDTVLPELGSRKGRDGVGRITDEATDSVRVQAEEEGDEQVVRVPEGLEALLPDAVVRRRVDEEHAKQHDVPGHTASLLVVDVEGETGTDLRPLDVVEAIPKRLAQLNISNLEIEHHFTGPG